MGRTLTATQVELRIFTQLIRAEFESESPLTVREICERTELKDGTIYPSLGKLANRDIVIYDESVKPAVVSLMPSFEAWQYALEELRHVQVFTGPLTMLNPYIAEPAAIPEV
ncbi:MAG TPA: hypothetical protein PKA02_02460 [Candidatus Saccharibacteria bacterium]|nr:hypothetical protein [Candidatus Saccharibacteria bacterium]